MFSRIQLVAYKLDLLYLDDPFRSYSSILFSPQLIKCKHLLFYAEKTTL